MAVEPSPEADLFLELWVARCGPTAFLCPRCSCERGYALRPFGRSRKCANRKCGAELSVTGSTLIAYSKIPVSAWADVLCAIPGTGRQIAGRYELALSSAWHCVLRVLRRAFVAVTGPPDRVFPVSMRLGRRVPFAASAPADVRALHAARGREAFVSVSGDEVVVFHGVSAVPAPLPDALELGAVVGALDRLRRVHRGVTLRWIPLWMPDLLRVAPPLRWVDIVLSLGHVPLRSLDPWATGTAG